MQRLSTATGIKAKKLGLIDYTDQWKSIDDTAAVDPSRLFLLADWCLASPGTAAS